MKLIDWLEREEISDLTFARRIERDASRRGQMDAMWRLYQGLLHPVVPRLARRRPAQR